jgi:hypothetical protein
MESEGVIATVLGFVGKIGDLFGNAIGFRIGGPIVMGIIAIVLIIKLAGILPSWLKWVLIIIGVVMFAGGGANILQTIA